MRKIAFILFSTIAFYCCGQEKIFLTTGDCLMGKVIKIDDEHSRITKSDGTSILILSSMIKRSGAISSMEFEGPSWKEDHKLSIGIHAAPMGAMRYEIEEKKFTGNSQPYLSFLGGFNLRYNFKQKVSFAVEINYEQKGSMYISSRYTEIFHTGYLTMPLGFNFRLNRESKKVVFYMNAGIYLGYLVNAMSVYKPKVGAMQKYYYVDLTNEKRFDWGLVTGWGWKIPVKERFLFLIEMRNNFGLFNLINTTDPTFGNFINYKIKNESFCLLLGAAYKI